jgi:hypothetical protein
VDTLRFLWRRGFTALSSTVYLDAGDGWVAGSSADPNDSGDITDVRNRRIGAGAPGTDDPSLDGLLSALNNLYKQIATILRPSTAGTN